MIRQIFITFNQKRFLVSSNFFHRFRRTDDSLNEMVWPEKFYQGRFDTERRREEKFKSRLRLDMEFYDMTNAHFITLLNMLIN